jgi:hypothetical protein
MDSPNNTKITVSRILKAHLDTLKHPGQSYAGYIEELITRQSIITDQPTDLKKVETTKQPIPEGYISIEKAQELTKAQWHKDIPLDTFKKWGEKGYLKVMTIDNTLIVEETSLLQMFKDYTL